MDAGLSNASLGQLARLPQLVALAMAKAIRALHAATVQFSAPPFTAQVARGLRVYMNLSGTTSAVDTPVTFSLLRDGVQIATSDTLSAESGHVVGRFAVSNACWDIISATGVAHTYTLSASAGGGATITVAANACRIDVKEDVDFN